LSKMGLGRSYMVYVYIDEETERIVATAKIDNHLEKDIAGLVEGQEVSLIPYEYTDLGIKALIDKKHIGIIYKSEVFQEVTLGQVTKGFIKKIRTDEKIDLSLLKQSYDRIDNVKFQIFTLLESNNGFLPYTDKTDSEVIYRDLQMSKKDFKKAIGGLYRENKIQLATDGIYIVK